MLDVFVTLLATSDAQARPALSEARRPGPEQWEFADLGLGCILRRMPRMQVYLPDDLYALVKARGLPASELLQKAVRSELRRQDLLAESERYVAALVSQVGQPTPAEHARAKAVAARIASRGRRKAG